MIILKYTLRYKKLENVLRDLSEEKIKIVCKFLESCPLNFWGER